MEGELTAAQGSNYNSSGEEVVSDVLGSMRFKNFVVSACRSECVKLKKIAGVYVKIVVEDVISHDHICSVPTVC